jgi:Ni,Fe-hydrogenase III large subunit
MNNLEIVLRVLGEKINQLETELYIKKLEIDQLKKKLENKEALNNE